MGVIMNTRYVLLLLLLGTATTSTNLLHASAPTPATWDCRTCTFRNEGTKQACELCTTAKPITKHIDTEDADAIAMVMAATGDIPVAAPHQAWSCSVCTTVNWPAKTCCEVCYAPRPAMRTAPRADDAALAARLQEEERMRYEREEAKRTAARTRERIAGERAAKRAADEAATQAAIAKIQAADEADERSRRAAARLAAQYAAEEEAERLNQIEADATLAQALAEADDVRRAQEEAATQALIAKLTGADKLTQADARLAQEEADRLVALRFEAEEVANAARLNQGAARAAAEIAAARRRGDEATMLTIKTPLALPPLLPPATICPAAPLLPNSTGTCFMNAMLHCLFSSSRLIDPIRVLGARSPAATALNNVLAAYCANSVPEGLLLALHQELLKLLPADHPRTGGDSAHTYQVLVDELHRLDPSISNQVIHLGLPDTTATPTSLEELINYYGVYLKHLEDARTIMIVNDKQLLPIDVTSRVLAFNIARALPGNAINKKPVTLPETLTLHGVVFKLTACACHCPDHAFAQKRCAAGWFACDDNRYVKAIPEATVTANNTEAYLVIYERI